MDVMLVELKVDQWVGLSVDKKAVLMVDKKVGQ